MSRSSSYPSSRARPSAGFGMNGEGQAPARPEIISGWVVALATLIGLSWANSPWAGSYEALWSTRVRIGSAGLGLEKPLVLWVNDLLMAVFFLLVAVEVKRELSPGGELDSPRKAALPAVAALGGMLAPAGVFVGLTLLLSAGGRPGPALQGWAVPVATDIAFARFVARLLGARVPPGLLVFLTALAIIDDLGAILIIALWYASDLSLPAHLCAAGLTLVLVGMNRCGVRTPGWYVLVGVPLWVAVLKSGVHATLAGVVTGLCIPARATADALTVQGRARDLLAAAGDEGRTSPRLAAATRALQRTIQDSESPARRLELALEPLVAFLIVPLFALANAGVSLVGAGPGELLGPVALGVAMGLFVGKQAGVLAAAWLARASGLVQLPRGTSWRHLHGASALTGIGFTMALFIAGLAYEEGGPQHVQAKLGVLTGSALSGGLGLVLLSWGARRPPAPNAWSEPGMPPGREGDPQSLLAGADSMRME